MPFLSDCIMMLYERFFRNILQFLIVQNCISLIEQQVAPAELECILLGHPRVSDCAVIP